MQNILRVTMMKLHMSYVKMMSPAFMIACVLNVPNIWQQLWLIIWSQHYTCFPPQQPELQRSLTQQMSKRSKSFEIQVAKKKQKKTRQWQWQPSFFQNLENCLFVPTVLYLGFPVPIQQLPTLQPPKFRNEYLQATSPQAPFCWK